MNAILSEKEQELNGATYMPAVSIILPFEPKMSIKTEVEHRLKIALGKVEKELVFNYPSEKAMPVINKLRQVIRELNFNTHQKSIAIFVSPLIERVFYLDIAVEEKIVVDESFEIRDLIYNKKQNIQYLILLLSSESSKMYLGNCSSFVLIKSNTPQNVYTYERDMPEKVTHFSDQHKHKETLTHKFVHHMDEGLSLILNAYPLPLFVLGPEKVIGHFKKITKNMKSIIEYIHGNFDNSTEPEIRQIMKPYVADWKKIKQQHTIQKITTAMSEKKLVHGNNKVWAEATHKNGQLLIVEKDFMYPAHLGGQADLIYKVDLSLNHPFYIKDAVDDVIEIILKSGGDVEFVDNGALKGLERIALIQYRSTFQEERVHFM